jgi:hypothetical protein
MAVARSNPASAIPDVRNDDSHAPSFRGCGSRSDVQNPESAFRTKAD